VRKSYSKFRIRVHEVEKVTTTIEETKTVTVAAGTVTTISPTTVITTKTFIEFKTVHQAPTT